MTKRKGSANSTASGGKGRHGSLGGPGSAAPAAATAVPAIVIAIYTGATMLGGQIGWMRLIQPFVGSGLVAGALSMAAAMAGLAIGAAVAARLLTRRPLGSAAVSQQLLCAAALLSSPWLIGWVGSTALAAVRGRFGGGGGEGSLEVSQLLLAASAGVTLAVLNIPFGMLLPTAVELDLTHRDRHLSRRGGFFYAFQSAGGVLGAVVLGLALPAAFGFRAALLACGAGHLALTGWLAWLNRRWPQLRRPPAVPSPEPEGRGGQPGAAESEPDGPMDQRPPRRGSVSLLAFWLGMLSLGAELVWLRGLVFFLKSNLYVYGLIAFVFIGGLTLGGLIGGWLTPLRRRPGQFLAAITLLIAITLAASAETIESVPFFLFTPAGGEVLGAAGWPALAGQVLAILLAVAIVVGPSAVLMGMAFPPLLRLAGTRSSIERSTEGLQAGVVVFEPGQAGRIVGRIAALGAFGSVLGPLLAYAVFPAFLDQQRALLALAVGYMMAALWAEVIDPATGWHRSRAKAARPGADQDHEDTRTRRQRIRQATQYRIPWLNMVLFVAAAGVCLWQSEDRSVFHDAYLTVEGQTLDERAETNTVNLLALVEAREAVVAVRRNTADGAAELLINQEVQGDDSPLALRVQRRQGLLPLVLAPADRLRRAMVVGLGTGSTVAPLVGAGVPQTTVAELVSPVISLALSQFLHANANLRGSVVPVFTRPRPSSRPTTGPDWIPPEVRILNADGRTVLNLEPGGWDLIVVDIVFPTAPGAGDLFSEQFYRLACQQLGDDGLFVHWLPLWQMSPADAASVVAAFLKGFVPSWAPFRAGVLSLPSVPGHGRPMVALVGARRPIDLGRAQLARRIERLRPAVDHDDPMNPVRMTDCDLGQVEQVWGSLLPESFLKRWAAGACPTTDWYPRAELRSPLGDQRWFGPDNAAELLRLGYGGDDYADEVARVVAPTGAGFDRAGMAQVFQSRRLLAQAVYHSGESNDIPEIKRRLAEAVQLDPDNAFARFFLESIEYDLNLAVGERQRRAAHQAIEQSLRPEFLRSARAAIDTFTKASRQYPHGLRALEEKAALQKITGRTAEAIDTLDEMIHLAPQAADPWYRKAQLLIDLADSQSARPGGAAEAGRTAGEAKAALAQAQALRTARPRAYHSLDDRIRAAIKRATSQPATAVN